MRDAMKTTAKKPDKKESEKPMKFTDAMIKALPADAIKVLLWEKSQGQLLLSQFLRKNVPVSASQPLVLAIGPEGGFEESETDYAVEQGFHLVACGKRILRSETAVLAALASAMAHIGEI